MERTPVQSSSVASIGYDKKTRKLEVEFIGGKVYRFDDVSPQKYVALKHSVSVGSYINRRIVEEHAGRRVK